MRYRGTPCQFFFLDVTTKLQRIHIFNETKLKIPSIDLYCLLHQNEFKTFLSLPTSSELSYKCQTKVQERFRLFWQVPDTSEEFLQTKVEFWVAIMFCFFWIFIEFYQVPDYSGKCQTKGFRLVWQMPDSSEHFF